MATGRSGPTEPLIRFVASPDGVATPDLAEKLPGRGVWVSADRAALARAQAKNLFAKALKAPATAPASLVDDVEALLLRRAIQGLSLARKAGQARCGLEKCREAATAAVGLVQARDGAPDGKARLRRLVLAVAAEGPPPVFETLDRAELGLAFGRPYAIHCVLTKGGAAARAMRDFTRLLGVRRGLEPPKQFDDGRPARSRAADTTPSTTV